MVPADTAPDDPDGRATDARTGPDGGPDAARRGHRRDDEGRGPGDEGPNAGAPRDSLLPQDHWSRTRTERNAAEVEYLRAKSRVPGMEGDVAERNHYCMECGGVLPLLYDRNRPADRAASEHCPHCGAELDANVRAMFNWVEIDQVPSSDAAAVLPIAFGALVLVVLVVVAIVFALG